MAVKSVMCRICHREWAQDKGSEKGRCDDLPFFILFYGFSRLKNYAKKNPHEIFVRYKIKAGLYMSPFKTLLSTLAVAVTVLFGAAIVPAHADAASEQAALDFVKATVERGLTFLSKPNSTEDEKKAEFKSLLNSSFDMDSIGRFSLGRYWNTATPNQQKEYMALFRKMVINVYAQRFGDYKGQKFEVKSVRPVGGSDALVTSYIIPTDGTENVQVDWRVRNKGGSMKIVDVYVAGVSMSVTQRSDFASVIQQGGGKIDVLIKYLKDKS